MKNLIGILVFVLAQNVFAMGEQCNSDMDCFAADFCSASGVCLPKNYGPGGREALDEQAANNSFNCSCHSFGSNNPYVEAACNALIVGSTCGPVGNIICVPRCQ